MKAQGLHVFAQTIAIKQTKNSSCVLDSYQYKSFPNLHVFTTVTVHTKTVHKKQHTDLGPQLLEIQTALLLFKQ